MAEFAAGMEIALSIYQLIDGVPKGPRTRHCYNISKERYMVIKMFNRTYQSAPGTTIQLFYTGQKSEIAFIDGKTGQTLGHYRVDKDATINHDGRTSYVTLNDPADGDVYIFE